MAKAREHAFLFLGGKRRDEDDPAESERLMEAFSLLIGRQPGASDFKDGQLDWEARAKRSPHPSRRRCDKLFRLRLEDRLARLRVQAATRQLLHVGMAAPEVAAERPLAS